MYIQTGEEEGDREGKRVEGGREGRRERCIELVYKANRRGWQIDNWAGRKKLFRQYFMTILLEDLLYIHRPAIYFLLILNFACEMVPLQKGTCCATTTPPSFNYFSSIRRAAVLRCGDCPRTQVTVPREQGPTMLLAVISRLMQHGQKKPLGN